MSHPYGLVRFDMVWAGDRVILFGGDSDSPLGDQDTTWELVGDEWNLLTPAHSPSARRDHKMIWTGSKVLMAGGVSLGPTTFYDETWEYDVSGIDWTQIVTADYPDDGGAHYIFRSTEHTMVWDTVNDRAIMLAYRVESTDPDNGNVTWVFDYGSGNWVQLSPSPLAYADEFARDTGDHARFGLHGQSAWADDRIIVFGGMQSYCENDIVEFDGSVWAEKVPFLESNVFPTSFGQPQGTVYGSTVWTGDRFFMFGGEWFAHAGTPVDVHNRQFCFNPDDLAIVEITTADRPAARGFHNMVWDGERVILFGGEPGVSEGPYFYDTWVLEPPPTPPTPNVASIRHTFGLG